MDIVTPTVQESALMKVDAKDKDLTGIFDMFQTEDLCRLARSLKH